LGSTQAVFLVKGIQWSAADWAAAEAWGHQEQGLVSMGYRSCLESRQRHVVRTLPCSCKAIGRWLLVIGEPRHWLTSAHSPVRWTFWWPGMVIAWLGYRWPYDP